MCKVCLKMLQCTRAQAPAPLLPERGSKELRPSLIRWAFFRLMVARQASQLKATNDSQTGYATGYEIKCKSLKPSTHAGCKPILPFQPVRTPTSAVVMMT